MERQQLKDLRAAWQEEKMQQAARKDPEALNDLGHAFWNGDKRYGINKNPDKAIEYLEKATLAGHAGAPYHLGEIYRKGEDVPQDLEKAKLYYETAIERKDLAFLAQYELDRIKPYQPDKTRDTRTTSQIFDDLLDTIRGYQPYETPHTRTAVAKDVRTELVDLLGKTTDPHEKQLAEYHLAFYLLNGHSPPSENLCVKTVGRSGFRTDEKDPVKAADLFNQAAKGQNKKIASQAAYELGRVYQEGTGVPKDIKQAKIWFKKAVEFDPGNLLASSSLDVINMKNKQNVPNNTPTIN